MATFALIDAANIVHDVIVADQTFIDQVPKVWRDRWAHIVPTGGETRPDVRVGIGWKWLGDLNFEAPPEAPEQT